MIRKRRKTVFNFNQNNSKDKSILELIPIDDYNDTYHCFIRNDGTCMDMMQIKSNDLGDMSVSDKDYMNMRFSKWYKTYAPDIKLIMMNYPTDTKRQQEYMNYKLTHTINEVQKAGLKRKLAELTWIAKNRSSREFYFMFWGKDIDDLRKNRESHIEYLGIGKNGYIEYMDKQKKIEILYKYNNQCSAIVKREEKKR